MSDTSSLCFSGGTLKRIYRKLRELLRDDKGFLTSSYSSVGRMRHIHSGYQSCKVVKHIRPSGADNRSYRLRTTQDHQDHQGTPGMTRVWEERAY